MPEAFVVTPATRPAPLNVGGTSFSSIHLHAEKAQAMKQTPKPASARQKAKIQRKLTCTERHSFREGCFDRGTGGFGFSFSRIDDRNQGVILLVNDVEAII